MNTTRDFENSPTTAHEALELTWKLTHPVKEGQIIPVGAWMVTRRGDATIVSNNEYFDIVVNDWDVKNRRTLDPLLEPGPDWLNAPAVLASIDEIHWQKVWLPRSSGRWVCTCCGAILHWSALDDVTPLWPEGKN